MNAPYHPVEATLTGYYARPFKAGEFERLTKS